MGHTLEIDSARRTPQSAADLLEALTSRQREVLAMLCEGLPNKLIARRLNISAGTVKVHIVHIHRALGVSSRLQAVVAARSLGFDGTTLVQTPKQPASRILSIPPQAAIQAAPKRDEGALPLLAAFMTRRLDIVLA